MKRLQAFVGRLQILRNGAAVIPAYGDLTLEGNGTSVSSPIGGRGEFYLDSFPAQKGHTSRAGTASLVAWLKESGRRARSVATATHLPVIKSCRNWGNPLAPDERTPIRRESFHYGCPS